MSFTPEQAKRTVTEFYDLPLNHSRPERSRMMRNPIFSLLLSLVAGATLVAQQSSAPAKAGQAMGARYEDRQWQVIVPELGADSPQISILRVDPVTQATQLLIRVPKQIHVPMHWHSANETHTVIRGSWTFEHEGMRHQL